MKKILLLYSILGLMHLSPLLAQRPWFRPQVHEVSISPISANHIMDWVQPAADVPYTLKKDHVYTLRYRYHFDKSSDLRVGIARRTLAYLHQPTATAPLLEATAGIWEIRPGYELKYNKGKWQLYGALDGIFQLAAVEEIQTATDPAIVQKNALSFTGMGGAGIVGLRFYVSEYLSVALENEYRYVSTTPKNQPLITEADYFIPAEKGFNLASLYLNLHFKRMKKPCACGKP